MTHIAEHGSHHTDVIVTEDDAVADHFIQRADSAIVMHNARRASLPMAVNSAWEQRSAFPPDGFTRAGRWRSKG